MDTSYARSTVRPRSSGGAVPAVQLGVDIVEMVEQARTHGSPRVPPLDAGAAVRRLDIHFVAEAFDARAGADHPELRDHSAGIAEQTRGMAQYRVGHLADHVRVDLEIVEVQMEGCVEDDSLGCGGLPTVFDGIDRGFVFRAPLNRYFGPSGLIVQGTFDEHFADACKFVHVEDLVDLNQQSSVLKRSDQQPA